MWDICGDPDVWRTLMFCFMEGVEKIMCVDKGNDALATAAMMNGGMGRLLGGVLR